GQGAVYQPQAPLHGSAAVGGAHPRSDAQAQAHHPGGRCPQPDQPALRLPLPHAVRVTGAVLLAERAGAQGDHSGALGGVSGAHRGRAGITAPPRGVGPGGGTVPPTPRPGRRSASFSIMALRPPTAVGNGSGDPSPSPAPPPRAAVTRHADDQPPCFSQPIPPL